MQKNRSRISHAWAPLRCDFALDFVERGGRSHSNQFKTTYYPSTVMEYHLFFSLGQNVPSREDWTIYRGPKFLAVIRFWSMPYPSPPPDCKLSNFLHLPVCRWSSLLKRETGGVRLSLDRMGPLGKPQLAQHSYRQEPVAVSSVALHSLNSNAGINQC